MYKWWIKKKANSKKKRIKKETIMVEGMIWMYSMLQSWDEEEEERERKKKMLPFSFSLFQWIDDDQNFQEQLWTVFKSQKFEFNHLFNWTYINIL